MYSYNGAASRKSRSFSSRRLLRLAIVASLVIPWAAMQYALAPVASAVVANGLDVQVYNMTVGASAPPDVSGVSPCGTATTSSLNYSMASDILIGNAWADGEAPFSTAPSCAGTDYVVHASGFLTIPGTYDGTLTSVQFYERSDAGFYMSLTDPESGGVKSMSNWSPHTLIVSSGQYSSTKSLSLLRGYTYDIDVWEWNDVSVGQLELLWNQPSTGTTIPPYSSAVTGGYRLPPSVGTRPLTNQRSLSFTPSADFISCVGDGNCIGSAPITVTVNGGDGVGAVSLTYESGPCTVATVSPATDPPTGTVTATGPGTCRFSATKAGDSVFSGTTSSTYSYIIRKQQSALTVTSGSLTDYGTMTYLGTLSLGTTGGDGNGAVTYNRVSGPCTVTSAGVLTATGAAPYPAASRCLVTATKDSGTDSSYTYDPVTSVAYSVYIDKAAQAAVTVSPNQYQITYQLPRGGTLAAVTTVTAQGGSGDGDFTFSVDGPCLVKPVGVTDGSTSTHTSSGNAVVVATGAGTCTVTAGRSANGDFLAANTSTTSISILKGVQPDEIVVTTAATTATYNDVAAPTVLASASGGNGLGAVTIAPSSASVGICSVGSSSTSGTVTTATVTALAPGSCYLVATRASDSDFVSNTSNEPTSPQWDVSSQLRAVVVTSSVVVSYNAPLTLSPVSFTGGYWPDMNAMPPPTRPSDCSSSPSYSAVGLPSGLSMAPATGVITGNVSNVQGATDAIVTVTDYNCAGATGVVSFTVNQAGQEMAWTSHQTATITFGDPVTALAATVVDGAPTYAVSTPDVCSVSSSTGILTVLTAGTCEYSASIPAGVNYSAARVAGSFDIRPAVPSPPKFVSASVDNTSVTVRWSTPTDLGGSDVAFYTATATTDGITSSCTASGSASSCDIVGLLAGATYRVVVTATTSPVADYAGKTSENSRVIQAYLPTSTVTQVAGSIPSRYDPNPPNTAVTSLTSAQQNNLLDAGIVEAPTGAPKVTITANLHDATFDVPIAIDIPQTVDSGSEVRVRVIPPQDTPTGAVLRATLTVTDGTRIDLGTMTLGATDIPLGITLSKFAMVTTGTYQMRVTIASPAVTAVPYALAAGEVVDDIAYRIKVVAGSSGVPSIAAAPIVTPSPTETPTESPTPTETPSETPTESPTPETSVDDRGLVVVDPLAAPVAVAKTAVAAVTLVSAVSAAASAAAAAGSAAGAGGAASGGGSSGGARSSGGSSGGSGGSSGGSGNSGGSDSGSDSGGTDGADATAQIQTVDVEHEVYEDLSMNWGDALGIWKFMGLTMLDQRSHKWTLRTASISPLVSKLITDGAYTRALVGVFSAILPIASIGLAVFSVFQNGTVLLPPPTALLMAMIVIGVFDAAAGALGFGIFAAWMAAVAGVHTVADVRMLLGLVVAGFAPTLLATAFRGLRRNAAMDASQWWERISDLAIAPFIAGWATKGMMDALSPLSGVQLPMSSASGKIGMAVAISVFIRILLEEFAAQYFPGRLNAIHPTEVPSPPIGQKIFALVARAATFFFVAEAFVGYGWYLWVGTFLFILPNFVGLVSDRFPNSPTLYQVLPAGLPGMAVQLYLASIGLTVLTRVLGETPDLAKFAFALLPIPSTILSLAGQFGREPRDGDSRWYQRDKWKWFYRAIGPVVLLYTIHLAGLI